MNQKQSDPKLNESKKALFMEIKQIIYLECLYSKVKLSRFLSSKLIQG